MMVLRRAALSVSIGPDRDRERIGGAVRAQQKGGQGDAEEAENVSGDDTGDNDQPAAD